MQTSPLSTASNASRLIDGCRRAWHPFWRDHRPPSPTDTGSLALLIRTSHFRQAGCFAFFFLLVTLGSIIWGQHLLEQVLVTHVKDMVTAEIRTQQMLDANGNAERLTQALRHREAAAPRRERATAVQAANGQLLHGQAALLFPSLCQSGTTSCHGWLRSHQQDADGSEHEWLAHSYALPEGGRYIIGYDILPMLDRIYPVPLAAGLSVFMVLLISLGVGLCFSLAGVRHINRIRQAMSRFARGDLNSRVDLHHNNDEFGLLGKDVNHALKRINHLMEAIRNATNHIAHELRTPLTRLQQRLSNIADAAQGDRAVALELLQAKEELQHIQTLFRTVMRISEIETGRCLNEQSAIDTRGLLNDLKDYYEVLADQRGLTLTVAIAPNLPEFVGDRALLLQALVNLVDNAFKYAPTGSNVLLLARADATHIALGVADKGPGIDADQRPQAVLRFQRLNQDRSIPGYGLGLALVQAITDLHDGELVLADNDLPPISSQRGLQALLRIPAMPDAMNVKDS
ncbi:HAMP domain-containing histidine kinase [Comamonas sp. Tr-654]|uniref:sensor histidine kinase n=1 Tax=Comamonas sp. Tr-654 TaxID=2608341 RepID=UPI00141DBA65|nr:HAMP domain-containing sensor histidine kinase [Comamonas sp. Tr-654]NIF86066.1 HAMP domain-containing histidine kinase [Comamonas sp. Tr-654]